MKRLGEIGITYLTTPPEGCLLLPTTITADDYPILHNVGVTEANAGNQLFVLNANQTITIRNPVFPVNRIASDADFGVLGRTGGVRTVTLTAAQIPAHTHTQNAHNHGQDWHNHAQDAHTHTQNWHTHTQNPHNHTAPRGGVNMVLRDTPRADTGWLHYALHYQATAAVNHATTATNQYTQATNHGVTVANHANTATNNNTGGGGAHTNLPPYTVVNYWICYEDI